MKKIVCAFLALFMLGALSGCGQDTKKAADKKPAAKETKVLRFGTNASFAPFEFQKKDSKDYSGFDMDLARAIGKQMGMKVEIVNTPFDGLIPALNSGTIDAAISGMTITDSRKKQVNFCTPYYKSGLIVMVKKDNTSIKSIKDLTGKKIAVQIGTTGAAQAHKVKDAKITEFNSNPEACLELKNGGVDAVIGDLPVEQYYLKQGGDKEAKLVGETLSAEEYGIALSKKNNDLLDKMNKALAELKKNGEYDKLYKQWFGAAPKK